MSTISGVLWVLLLHSGQELSSPVQVSSKSCILLTLSSTFALPCLLPLKPPTEPEPALPSWQQRPEKPPAPFCTAVVNSQNTFFVNAVQLYPVSNLKEETQLHKDLRTISHTSPSNGHPCHLGTRKQGQILPQSWCISAKYYSRDRPQRSISKYLRLCRSMRVHCHLCRSRRVHYHLCRSTRVHYHRGKHHFCQPTTTVSNWGELTL